MSRSPLVQQLMITAMVQVRDIDGNFKQCRTLLDTCATANFISYKFARESRSSLVPCKIPIDTMASSAGTSSHYVQIVFKSMVSNYHRSLTFLTVSCVSDLVPKEPFNNPDFHKPRPVDMLIGAGPTVSMLSIGQIDLSRNNADLILQKTRLGWVVAGGPGWSNVGKISTAQTALTSMSFHTSLLSSQISRFWEIEKLKPSKGFEFGEGYTENTCEIHFQQTAERLSTGRYIYLLYRLRLPFKIQNVNLGESGVMAIRRLRALERKLSRDAALNKEYQRVLTEYLELGHMTEIVDVNEDGYYMPHHVVIKENSTTTKLRVVFDASAKSNSGRSLNDVLMIGPTVQDKLVDHLMRFRLHRYVITADIEKMYRQIWIHPDDRKYQRIVWRNNDKFQTYQLNTVTFGVASAPFLAMRTLKQLTKDESSSFPRVAAIIKRDLYVDDLLTGTDTASEIPIIREEISNLLKRRGFVMRKWASNHPTAFDSEREVDKTTEVVLDKNSVHNTLGVIWNMDSDKLGFRVDPIILTNKVTKRNILSSIAKINDPLGLLGLIILYAKGVMQRIWRSELTWDESVPQHIHTE